MKLKIILLLAILLTFINLLVFTVSKTNEEQRIQLVLEDKIKTLKTHYEILLQTQKTTAVTIYQSTIESKRVIEILSQALTATKAKKVVLRDELKELLKSKYARAKQKGVLQYQFVFPDNKVFLRVHKPEKYGDDLTDVRADFRYANETKKPLRGFTQGRTAHGFRNVFPILDKNNKHIGAMEISFSSDHFQWYLNDISNIHTHFLVNKKIFNAKTWKRDDLVLKYHQSAEHPNYMLTLGELHSKEKCIAKNRTLLKPLRKDINEKISLDKEFSLYAKNYEGDNHVDVISFLPIKNLNHKTVAWLVSYEESPFIHLTIESGYMIRIVSFILSIVLIYFIIQQILFRKKLEIAKNKAEQKTQAKGEFLANMSHEIRTPLNAILGFVDLLKNENLEPKSIKYVNIISTSSKSLLKIIEDILDFSKIESGKLDLDTIDFNAKEEFIVITHLFSAKCLEKNISLSLNVNENLPQVIHTDPLRIKQIISNLLSNAIKFTNKGKIIVDINYEENTLNVSVKDNGKGIAEDKLSYIFESFSQEDTSTTREYGGTGLGLSISSALVKLLGGELQVKSTLGKGSEFYFSIPVTIGEELEMQIEHSENITFDGKKILLVEDNKANQMFMQIVLEEFQLEVDIANDGIEAVEAFKHNKYDAILMDENMPNLNGIEATKQILAIEVQNNLEHTPIIALTANAIKGDRERFLSVGMDEYIAKPLDIKILTKILNKFLH